MVNLKKTKQVWSLKFKKRNPIAKDLRTSPQYKQKIVRDKTVYDRKNRNDFLQECKEVVGRWGREIHSNKD